MTTQYVSICKEDTDGNVVWEQVGLNLVDERIVVVSPEKYIDNPPWQKIYEGFVRQVKYTQSLVNEQRWFRDTILLVKVDKSKE